VPWVKGQSGNAKGAPRRNDPLARLVREQTKQGLELVEFNLSVLRGEVEVKVATKGGDVVEVGPSVGDRLAASRWLADRGWGKAVERVEISDETAIVEPAGVATDALEQGLGPEGTIQ
jgi:hypothetical protein